MPACLFPSADYEQSLRRRRLAGAGLLVLGALQLLAKQEESRRFLAIASVAAFICAILLPATLIGGCAKPEMSCNVLTYPCVYAISVIGIIVQAINAFTKNSQR